MLLVLYFGVDYRYVEAPYIGMTWHVGFLDIPLHPGAVPGVLALIAVQRALHLYRLRIMAVAQDQTALQLVAVDPVASTHRSAFRSRPPRWPRPSLSMFSRSSRRSAREYIGRVFAICVLGGMWAACRERLSPPCWSASSSLSTGQYRPAVSFGFLLLTLAVRPASLLGR